MLKIYKNCVILKLYKNCVILTASFSFLENLSRLLSWLTVAI